SVAIAGAIQIVLGALRFGAFTHFIPSAVIKGMLAAIGIILMSKQVPLLVGYDQPDFWRKELFNIFTLDHAYSHIDSLYHHTSAGVIVLSLISLLVLFAWKKYIGSRFKFLPASIITVAMGMFLAWLFANQFPYLMLSAGQFVNIPPGILSGISMPDFH